MTERKLIPGSEWLFFKLYTGHKSADDILVNNIKSYTEQLLKEGAIDGYFFIRYTDPEFHLRFRLHIPDPAMYGKVFSKFYEYFKPAYDNNIVKDIICDTYTRELERYGDVTMELTEKMFYVDSRAIIDLLASCQGMSSLDREHYRWKLSMLLIDDIFTALEYDDDTKVAILTRMSDNFKREFNFTSNTYTRQLNDKYRALRKDIDQAMEDKPFMQRFSGILEARKQMLSNIWQDVKARMPENNVGPEKDNYTGSLIHMTMNRLFKSKNRIHEMVIYDFLLRYHKSAIAKAKYSKK